MTHLAPSVTLYVSTYGACSFTTSIFIAHVPVVYINRWNVITTTASATATATATAAAASMTTAASPAGCGPTDVLLCGGGGSLLNTLTPLTNCQLRTVSKSTGGAMLGQEFSCSSNAWQRFVGTRTSLCTDHCKMLTFPVPITRMQRPRTPTVRFWHHCL